MRPLNAKIVQSMSLGRTKARYLMLRGLGEHAEKETIQKVKNCDAFSMAIDESEVNKKSELEVMVKVSTEEGGIESKHLGCLDLPAGNAETIKNTLIDFLEEKQIDFKSTLIDLAMDGCNTMQGHKSGVITQFCSVVDELQSTGSCNAHNLANVMKHATNAFDSDVKDAMVNIFIDLGGQEGYGLKKKKDFESLCASFGFKPSPFKRFVDTRFRTHQNCLVPVIRNYSYIVKYYKSLKKPTPRQILLRKFFVDNQDVSLIKLYFVLDSNSEFTSGVDFFEENQSHVHNTGDMLENILVGQYRKTFDETEINQLDENDQLKRKSRKELINLDIESAKKLDNKRIFIGQNVEKLIKSLGLSPTSPALTWFFEAVRRYHLTACKYLQKYFRTPLGSSIIANLSALHPKNQRQASTPAKLKSLVKKHTKVAENISKVDGQNKLNSEIDRYVTDDDIVELNETNYETFWSAVGELKDGTWPRYEILSRFALALGTRYDATSDVERSFSVMNSIHQNTQRNCMSQETLNANLHIRSAIQNKDSFNRCEKCQRGEFKDHCHCSLFQITDSLRERCKAARSLQEQASKEKNNSNNNASGEEVDTKRKAFEREEEERKLKLREDLKRGKNIWSQKNHEPVFSSRKHKDENKNQQHSSAEMKRKSDHNLKEMENPSKKTKSSQSLPKTTKK